MLEKLWKNFVALKFNKNSLVVIEALDQKKLSSKSEAIMAGAESAYMEYLAREQKYKIVCPEPSFDRQAKLLLHNFSKDQIEYYFFARTIAQWHRYKIKPDFKRYIDKFLEMDQRDLGWKNYDFSLRHMKKIHSDIFKKKFDYLDRGFFRRIVSPARSETVINQLARVNSENREQAILGNIEKYWKQKKNLFIVYGYAHAFIQRPAIRQMVLK